MKNRQMIDAAESYLRRLREKRRKTGAPVNCPFCGAGNIRATELIINPVHGISGISVKCGDCKGTWNESD